MTFNFLRCVAWNFSRNVKTSLFSLLPAECVHTSKYVLLHSCFGNTAYLPSSGRAAFQWNVFGWKSDRSGTPTLPGIVKLSALLYYTLDTCASNPEDNYAYNQCILFARCKLSWKIRLLIFIDWFLFDGSVFQRALRIFSNAMSRNSCCKYNIARYRFANFFTCLYQQVFSWVINRFINRKAIDNECDKKCCW